MFTERLDLRISEQQKQDWVEYAVTLNQSLSKLIREVMVQRSQERKTKWLKTNWI